MSDPTDPIRRRLLALAVVVTAGGLFILTLSSLHVITEEVASLTPRFRRWYVEDAGSPAFLWRAGQAFAIAALLAATSHRTKERWPIPWIGVYINLGLAIATHYHEDVGDLLADVAGVGGATEWAEMWMAAVTGVLIVIAFLFAPRAPSNRRLAQLTAAVLVVGVGFDLVTSAAGGGRPAVAAAHVEAVAEFAVIGVALLVVAHHYLGASGRRADDAVDPTST